jgi:hypothetical protein
VTSHIRKTEDVIATVVIAVFAFMLLACSFSIGAQREQIGDLNERVRALESVQKGD